MIIITNYVLPCIYSFFACIGFGLIFNIKGRKLLFSALGGMIGWLVYLISAGIYINDIPQYFLAAAAVSVYSEIMARVNKVPVTVYLVVSIIPLVPGGHIYYSMEALITGQKDLFFDKITYTFAIAGSIALGVFIFSSFARLLRNIKKKDIRHRN